METNEGAEITKSSVNTAIENTIDVEAKMKELEEKYEAKIKAKEEELERKAKEAEARMEKRLAQIEEATVDAKTKEKLSAIEEKDKQLEKENAMQKRLDQMEADMKVKEHKLYIKDLLNKNPYLVGHVEHTESKESLDSLIKREGDTWKKLYAYENSGNKNKNVTGGYNINKNIGDEANLNNKVKNWQDIVKKYLPRHQLQTK